MAAPLVLSHEYHAVHYVQVLMVTAGYINRSLKLLRRAIADRYGRRDKNGQQRRHDVSLMRREGQPLA
jgi:hypothetical protein